MKLPFRARNKEAIAKIPAAEAAYRSRFPGQPLPKPKRVGFLRNLSYLKQLEEAVGEADTRKAEAARSSADRQAEAEADIEAMTPDEAERTQVQIDAWEAQRRRDGSKPASKSPVTTKATAKPAKTASPSKPTSDADAAAASRTKAAAHSGMAQGDRAGLRGLARTAAAIERQVAGGSRVCSEERREEESFGTLPKSGKPITREVLEKWRAIRGDGGSASTSSAGSKAAVEPAAKPAGTGPAETASPSEPKPAADAADAAEAADVARRARAGLNPREKAAAAINEQFGVRDVRNMPDRRGQGLSAAKDFNRQFGVETKARAERKTDFPNLKGRALAVAAVQRMDSVAPLMRKPVDKDDPANQTHPRAAKAMEAQFSEKVTSGD